MKILQAGVPKSGNYWLYTINKHLIEKSDVVYSSYIQNQPIYEIAREWELSQSNQAQVDVLDITPNQIINRISRIYEMPIDDFDAYLNQTTISWTHSKFYQECVNIYGRFDKLIYIIRDPRAVALSAAKFQKKEYSKVFLGSLGVDPQEYLDQNLEFMLKKWVFDVISYLEISKEIDIYTVHYENLKINPSKEIRNLANYLSISITPEQLENIVDAVSLKSMKENNPEHVRKGKLYEWKEKLSNFQQWKVDFVAGPLLDIFGYPNKKGRYTWPIGLQIEPTTQQINNIKKRAYLNSALSGGWKYIKNKMNQFK